MKSLNILAFNLNMRILPEPEYAHPAWNNFKSAVRYTNMLPTMLKAVLMSHINHGPYDSGATMQKKLEAMDLLCENMTGADFARLQEDIAFDRCCQVSSDKVPQTIDCLKDSAPITKRGVYAACAY